MTKKNVLLMGVHGRIGEHMYLELSEGANLIAFSRQEQAPMYENITFIKKYFLFIPEAEEPLRKIDVVVFYEDPIMRLNRLTQGKFYDLYLLIADNIARAASTNNVEQIIYIADELSDGSILS